jgi:GTP cyclohydrolase I
MNTKNLTENLVFTSDKIRQRLGDTRFFSNDNIAKFMEPGDLESLIDEVAGKMRGVLSSLVIDQDNDHNAQDTAQRVAKMYVTELFAGRYTQQPTITAFPNDKNLDQMYVVGPITVNSCCAHHLVPIIGRAWVGVLAGKNVLGLSKYHRLVNWLASRPNIQEEFTMQVADTLETLVEPRGIAVLVEANHMCCSIRGVKDVDSRMVTSEVRGLLRESPSAKEEFFRLVEMTK